MKQMIITCVGPEPKVAVLEHGRLMEMYLERPVEKRMVGNIYKGKVANVLPGMQAAFIDIGLDKNAFLYIDDALPAKIEDNQKLQTVPIQDVLREGQEIIVQVSKEPIGTKGARVTTHLALPGRHCVYMPSANYVG
ncbi:MAG: ribonuclease G, partial [Bacilli bacterium]